MWRETKEAEAVRRLLVLWPVQARISAISAEPAPNGRAKVINGAQETSTNLAEHPDIHKIIEDLSFVLDNPEILYSPSLEKFSKVVIANLSRILGNIPIQTGSSNSYGKLRLIVSIFLFINNMVEAKFVQALRVLLHLPKNESFQSSAFATATLVGVIVKRDCNANRLIALQILDELLQSFPTELSTATGSLSAPTHCMNVLGHLHKMLQEFKPQISSVCG